VGSATILNEAFDPGYYLISTDSAFTTLLWRVNCSAASNGISVASDGSTYSLQFLDAALGPHYLGTVPITMPARGASWATNFVAVSRITANGSSPYFSSLFFVLTSLIVCFFLTSPGAYFFHSVFASEFGVDPNGGLQYDVCLSLFFFHFFPVHFLFLFFCSFFRNIMAKLL
jgi:hypothetical protein